MDVENDRIFQTTNIMYTLSNPCFSAHDIYALTKFGVNIFNIDRTLQSEEYLNNIKDAISGSEKLPEMYPLKYRMPVSLALTVDTKKYVDIDERVNLLIVKGIENLEEFLHLKSEYKFIHIPIMIWIEKCIEDMKELIKFSDGLIVDCKNFVHKHYNIEIIIDMVKEASKVIFYVIGDITSFYQENRSNDRKILAIADEICKYKLDGVTILDGLIDRKNRENLIRKMVSAIEFVENPNSTEDYFEISFKIKTPVFPPMSAALAASLAAIQSEASVIIVLTTSGISARWIANAAPPCYILAVTARSTTARRLHLYRKVIPLLYEREVEPTWAQKCNNRVQFATNTAFQIGLCLSDSTIVVLAPSSEYVGYCNSFKVISLPLKYMDLVF